MCTSPLEYLEQIVPLTFVEELMDVLTLTGCERLFDYVESQKDRLIIVSELPLVETIN
jgi:hypothetical protein